MAQTQTQTLELRPLGSQGLVSPAQGYGCMGLSWAYGSALSHAEAAPVLDAVVGLGLTHLDTAWIYTTFREAEGVPHNEELVGAAIRRHGRARLVIADKIGVDVRASPPFRQTEAEITEQLEQSLARLGTDYLDLCYLNRPSPFIPIEDTIRIMKKWVEAGKVRHLGLIEVTAADIRRAHAVHPITAVQLEWSLFTRDVEATVVPACRELGIGIVAYSPIARGLLSATFKAEDVAGLSSHDYRKRSPRFADAAHLDTNLAKVAAVEAVAARRGVTPAQIALAWLHSKGKDVFPIPGSKRPDKIAENLATAFIELTPAEIAELDAIGEAAGDRYHGMHGTFNARERLQAADAAAKPASL